MDSFTSVFVYWLVATIVVAVVFFLLRSLVLWYFRLNEIADNLAIIATHYARLDREATKQRASEIRTTSPRPHPSP